MELEDGGIVRSDATLWTTGFWASPLAGEAGLAVDARGRIVVDVTLRSVSHPTVFAIGDAAAIHLAWGEIHGTCQSGIPSGAHAAGNIGRLVRGRKPKPFRFGYWHQPLSLGRNDAVIQFTKRDDTPCRLWIKGARAVAYKELVTSSPLATYRIARRWAFPVALLSARGGRATRRPPSESIPLEPRRGIPALRSGARPQLPGATTGARPPLPRGRAGRRPHRARGAAPRGDGARTLRGRTAGRAVARAEERR